MSKKQRCAGCNEVVVFRDNAWMVKAGPTTWMGYCAWDDTGLHIPVAESHRFSGGVQPTTSAVDDLTDQITVAMKDDAVPRILSMYDEMTQIVVGRTLTCTTCGAEQPADGGNYFRDGWPRCCGYTMRLGDAP